MDVLIILVFVSLVLVCGAVLLMLVSLNQRDFEHAERLSLLPLLDSNASSNGAAASSSPAEPSERADETLPPSP